MTVQDPVEEREVRELFARAKVEERPGFRSDLRSRLLAQVGPAATARRTPWWVIRVPRFALAGVAVVAMLFGGTGLAAAGSLPGDPFFEVKRAAEELALALAFDDGTRVQRLADQVSARSAELQRASDGTAKTAAAIESARSVERLDRETRELEARDPDAAAISRAAQTLQHATDVLRALESTLPAEAQDGIRRAIEAAGGSERGPRPDPTPPPGRAPGVAPATPDARPSAQPTPRGPEATPARSEPGRPANVPSGPPARTPEALRPSPTVPTPPATGR